MDRRTCLVGVGTVAIAGCMDLGLGGSDESESEDNEPEEESEPESTGESAPESQPESEPRPESEPQDESPTTNEDPQAENDPEPENDDRGPSDEVEYERSLYRAEEQYRLALREYGRSAGGTDPTFLDVLPSTDVDAHNAREYLDEASDILWTDTRDKAVTPEDETQVREYRTYDDLIVDLARVQRYIHRTYSRIEPVETTPRYTTPPSELTSAKNDHEELGEVMADSEIYMSELQRKYDQQAWQIELLERTFTGLVNVRSPQSRDRTQTQLQLARYEFSSVIDQLEDPTSAPPEDRTDREFLALVREWYERSDEMLREAST